MAWTRPTFDTLRARITSDIETALTGSMPSLRGTLEYALAFALAKLSDGLHGHVDNLIDQIFPDTQLDEYFWKFAGNFGIYRKAAVPWSGTWTTTVTAVPSEVLMPIGTVLQSPVTGGYYVTTDAAAAGGAGMLVPVAAATGYEGAAYSLTTSSVLTLVSPVAGVTSSYAGVTSLVGGVDQETRAAAYARLLQRMREAPGVGTDADYVRWALEIAGVTRAWVQFEHAGPGTVAVYPVRDGESPIIPDAGELAAVEAYMLTVAPGTDTVSALALTATDTPFTISITPDTTVVRNAAQAELEDLLRREGGPGITVPLSRITEAISAADGETSHVLTAPAASVTAGATEVHTVGTITWL